MELKRRELIIVSPRSTSHFSFHDYVNQEDGVGDSSDDDDELKLAPDHVSVSLHDHFNIPGQTYRTTEAKLHEATYL